MTTPPPLPVRSARAEEIVRTARRLLEEEGHDAVTMRRLGEEVGMRAPSLYKHFPNKGAVEAALVDVAFTEMGTRLHAAVRSPGRRGAVRSVLDAYREVGRSGPNLYRLATGPGLPRDLLTPGLEDWAGQPFYLATGDPHVAQALWAFAHGMTILEIEDRFSDTSDLDRTWRAGAAAFASQAAAG